MINIHFDNNLQPKHSYIHNWYSKINVWYSYLIDEGEKGGTIVRILEIDPAVQLHLGTFNRQNPHSVWWISRRSRNAGFVFSSDFLSVCQGKVKTFHSKLNAILSIVLQYLGHTHTHTHTSKWQHTNFQQNKRDRHTFLNINVLVLTYSLHDFQVNNLHKLSFIHKIFHRLAFAHKDEN